MIVLQLKLGVVAGCALACRPALNCLYLSFTSIAIFLVARLNSRMAMCQFVGNRRAEVHSEAIEI